MSRLLRIPVLGLFFIATTTDLVAQVDGKIVGTITDRATGLPLAGAVITIKGTELGNVSGEDGVYFMNLVPVGVRQVAVEYLGYQPETRELRILAGQTATADFALESAAVEVAEVVAVIEREPLLVRDKTASKTHFTAEDAVELPMESVDEIVALSPGVYEGQGGFIIRGGRGSESATYVDGVLISEFTTQRDLTELGAFAIEEIDVVTGGFGAEFGHAQSGIINIVTRSAGTEFHGSVRYTTDGHFGTDGIDAEEAQDIEDEPCCGYNSLQMTLGGPLVPERLTLFGSLEAVGAADIDPRAGGFNPTHGEINSYGSTRGILPGNRGDRTRLHLKTTAILPRVGSLGGTVIYSRDQEERYGPLFGLGQQLSGSAIRSEAWDLILSWDRTLFRSADRESTLRVLAHSHRSESHSGVPESPEAAAVLRANLGDACGSECDVSEDTFESDVLNYRFHDVQFFFEDSLPGSVPTLRFAHPVGPDPVFGIAPLFLGDGIHHAFSHSEERRTSLRVDLDSQLDRFQRLKVGTEWTWIDLGQRSGWLHQEFLANTYDVRPIVGAAYVQHRWDSGDLVLDLGLRWDHWDPRTTFPATPAPARTEGRTRDAVAPRIGVAHPATDRTQVRVSFGQFYQLPELQHYFARGFNFGNPWLDYIRTTALEMGVTHLISETTGLDVVAYYRDRKGAIRLEWYQPGDVFPTSPEMHVFVNGDHGNVRGVDLTLSRRFPPYLSTDVTWSLQWARGTTGSPLEWFQFFGFLPDPLNPGRRLLPPNQEQPDSYDRLHTFDTRVALQVPAGFHGGTLLGEVLENVGATFVYKASSGTPYTLVRDDGYAIGDLGSARGPWAHEANLRLVKGLPMESGANLDIFMLVLNVFGQENTATGVVNQNSFEFENSRDPIIPRNFLNDDAPWDFPVRLADVRPEYVAAIARQDLDRDGVITLAEAQESLRQALVATGGDFSPYSYGPSRQVRFGVELRF